jgi:DNA mismatch repair protein MutL
VENAPALEEAGVFLEPSEATPWLSSRSRPSWRPETSVVLLDLAEEVGGDTPSGKGISTLRDRMLVFMSCRGAVKARQDLSREEALALLTALGDEPQAATCPHGRPVVVRFGAADLEKLFHRR